jgi:hypothetical protein
LSEIEIGDLNSIGLIRDQEGHYIPPEALTFARNVRAVPDGVERIGGQLRIFGSPPIVPHFALPVQSPSSTFWLYVSLTKGEVWNGTNHTDITRAAGDYTATETRQWNGTLLGGIPILNNGLDDPQYWPALDVGVKLAKLLNWPAATKAAVIRSFGPYLIALNTTEGGINYPHTLIWSHPADPGALPISWDFTDPTMDAGRNALPDVGAGIITDGLPLRGHFYIYKENSTWRMTQVGGQFIFNFDTFLESSGILAPRCVALTGDGANHLVATQDDIILHNGNTAQSLLTNRYKRYLNNTIDTINYRNSFVFANPYRDEMVFCYPEAGFTHPNRGLLWNYKNGQMGVLTEIDVNYRNAAYGQIESAPTEQWDQGTSLWQDFDGSWSDLSRRRVILCGITENNVLQQKFHAFDDPTTFTFDGVPFTGMVQRENLALLGKKRNGEWIVDFEKRKMLRRLWIRAAGGPISVRVGFTEQMNGLVSWTPAQTFTPNVQHWVDFFGSGRAVSVEFSATVPFKVLSYKLEGEAIGEGI